MILGVLRTIRSGKEQEFLTRKKQQKDLKEHNPFSLPSKIYLKTSTGGFSKVVGTSGTIRDPWERQALALNDKNHHQIPSMRRGSKQRRILKKKSSGKALEL